MPLKRFEILLPLRYNDGTPIEAEKFEQTRKELVTHFGGTTFEPQPMRGFWMHEGIEYQDLTVRVIVDTEDTPEAHEFFTNFKETLKERFRQLEVWITFFSIGRI
jgi:hypothetical protein